MNRRTVMILAVIVFLVALGLALWPALHPPPGVRSGPEQHWCQARNRGEPRGTKRN